MVLQDLRRELVEDFVWPAVRAGLVYEGRYLLGTALARPCITRALVALAKKVKAGKPEQECSFTGFILQMYITELHSSSNIEDIEMPMCVMLHDRKIHVEYFGLGCTANV